MANTIPLDKMSVEEKIQAMESLWDDLCRKAGGVSSPSWHEEVLTERDAMHKRGDDEFEDWDAAKSSQQDLMKIQILASASQDLIDGYRFPARQAANIGSHLLNSLDSDPT